MKAADLVDLTGASALSLEARRTINILLKNAHGPRLADPHAKFEIALSELTGTHDSNDRVVESVKALMRVVVQIDGDPSWDAESTGLTHLLGDCDIASPNREHGKMRYSFPPKMANLLASSSVYTRMQIDLICAFRSKYSLCLYEMVSKRIKLNRQSEEFDVPHFRDLMGVPSGKLEDWSNFRKVCLDPAMVEVGQIAPFGVCYKAIKEGRSTVRVRLIWTPKDDIALREAGEELARHSAGRKPRRMNSIETVVEE